MFIFRGRLKIKLTKATINTSYYQTTGIY